MSRRCPVGFIQGRLSPMVDGQVQAFPWESWESEFRSGALLEFDVLEWTLDHDRLYENPLLRHDGRSRIRDLVAACHLPVTSLTADFGMQAPFHRSESAVEEKSRLRELRDVLEAAASVEIGVIVWPLVDQARIQNASQLDRVSARFIELESLLVDLDLRIAFESDLPPKSLANFIKRFPSNLFGITYDIGNSASLGHSVDEEFDAYGERVIHVHVKDRLRGGGTVPLGSGAADFDTAFGRLSDAGYEGALVLQTARAPEGRDAEVLSSYRSMVLELAAGNGLDSPPGNG